MKKIFLILALSTLAFAQQDVLVSGIGPVRLIANNALWAGGGTGALANNYIFVPAPGKTSACIHIQNNTAASRSITISAFGNGNVNPIAYTNNTGSWFGPLYISTAGPMVVPSLGSTFASVRTSGATRVVLSVTTGGGAGSASIFMVEGDMNAPCAGVIPTTIGSAGSGMVLACSIPAHAVAAPSATTLIEPGISGLSTYVCGLTASTSAALTGNGFSIVRGTQTVTPCDTGTITIWGPFQLASAVGGSPYVWGGALGQVMSSTAPGEQLCITSAATVGTVDINVWLTQF